MMFTDDDGANTTLEATNQLFVNSTDPTNCLSMLLIGRKGGSKYDDEGVIRCSNYKNVTTGWYELGCVEEVNSGIDFIDSHVGE